MYCFFFRWTLRLVSWLWLPSVLNLLSFFYITNLLNESIKLFLECSFVFTTITLTLDSLFGSYFYKNIFGTNLIFPKKCGDKSYVFLEIGEHILHFRRFVGFLENWKIVNKRLSCIWKLSIYTYLTICAIYGRNSYPCCGHCLINSCTSSKQRGFH